MDSYSNRFFFCKITFFVKFLSNLVRFPYQNRAKSIFQGDRFLLQIFVIFKPNLYFL